MKNTVNKKDVYQGEEYLENNPNWHIEDSPWKAAQVKKLLDRNKINAKTFCEVGCGAGEILVQLAKNLPEDNQFVGYDISDKLYSFWEPRTVKDKIEFHNKDFFDDSDIYDCLMMIDVVEHIPNDMDFLQKLKARGEYKVFNIPLEISALRALFPNKFVESRKKYGHVNYYNPEVFLYILEHEVGFEVVDYFLAPGAIDLANTTTSISPVSKMLRIPRIILSKFSPKFTARLLGGYSLFVLAK